MLLYIQKMAQEPIEKIQNSFPFHVISNSAIPRVIKQLSTVPDDVLFSELVQKCPDLVERLKVGFVHGVAQFFQESNSTHGVVMLFYRTSKEEKSSHRRSYLNELFATHVMDGNYYDPAEHTIVSPLNIVNPAALEESLSETASFLCEKVQQSGSSFSIYFGFVDSPHLAAWTYRCEQDLYLVCISTGTYVRLRALFHILSFAGGFNTATNPNGSSVGVFGFRNILEKSQIVDEAQLDMILMRGDSIHQDARTIFERLASYELKFFDDRHLFDTNTLLKLAMAYVFWHEASHALCGHLETLYQQKSVSRLCERPEGIADVDSGLSHGIELLADHYAAIVLSQFVENCCYPPFTIEPEALSRFSSGIISLGATPSKIESFAYRASFALFSTIASFDLSRTPYDSYLEISHPHPEQRYERIFTTIHKTLASKPSLAEKWQQGMSRAFYDLSHILPSAGIPNVLFRTARFQTTESKRFRMKASGHTLLAYKATHDACVAESVFPAYHDQRILKADLEPLTGSDLEETYTRWSAELRSGDLIIGVFDTTSAIDSDIKDHLQHAKIISYDPDINIQEGPDVSASTVIDAFQDVTDAFVKAADHLVIKVDSLAAMGLIIRAVSALIESNLQSLTLIGNESLKELFMVSLSDQGQSRLLECESEGRFRLEGSFSIDRFLDSVRLFTAQQTIAAQKKIMKQCYEKWSKAELYQLAKELKIARRSTMNKSQLVKAIRSHQSTKT
jgi:hypothetical protein